MTFFFFFLLIHQPLFIHEQPEQTVGLVLRIALENTSRLTRQGALCGVHGANRHNDFTNFTRLLVTGC